MKDITDTIEAYVAMFDDGEVDGVYLSEREAERATLGSEGVRIIRMIPADEVIISG